MRDAMLAFGVAHLRLYVYNIYFCLERVFEGKRAVSSYAFGSSL